MNDHFSCPLPNFVGEEDECLPTCGSTNYVLENVLVMENIMIL